MGTAINTLWGGSNLGKLGMIRTPLTAVAAEQLIVGGIEHWGAYQAGSDYNDSNPSSIFGPRFAREAVAIPGLMMQAMIYVSLITASLVRQTKDLACSVSIVWLVPFSKLTPMLPMPGKKISSIVTNL